MNVNKPLLPFAEAERRVESLLKSQGHRILARNFAIHNLGEIDIISLRNGVIFATEVKARQHENHDFGAETKFIRTKQRRIINTLYAYLAKQGQFDRPLALLAAEVFWDRQHTISKLVVRPWESGV